MSPDEKVHSTDLENSEVLYENDPEIDIESILTASPEETNERVDTDWQLDKTKLKKQIRKWVKNNVPLR